MNNNFNLTGKFPSQTFSNQVIREDGVLKTGDGNQISYWAQGGITSRTSDDPNFWTNNPKWVFNLTTLPINQGRYVLSGNSFTGVNINGGQSVINNEGFFKNYLVTADFTGRFMDGSYDQYNVILIRAAINGIPTTQSCLLGRRSNNTSIPNNSLYRNMSTGSITFTYGSDTDWNLDFLVTAKSTYVSNLSDEFRFDTFWWTISTI